MTRRDPRRRSGITLTEILISIMILGIGMVSLATLFPVGLMRIRAAQRASLSVSTGKQAIEDISVRNLFDKQQFLVFYASLTGGAIDVWTQDGGISTVGTPTTFQGVSRTFGTGLPVAYDPLFWSESQIPPSLSTNRFGASTSLRNDPTGSQAAASDGFQRITSLNTFGNPAFQLQVTSIFVSPDNPVTQAENGPTYPLTNAAVGPVVAAQNSGASPVVPDLSANGVVIDYAYSWLFTGRQSDANDWGSFDGSIVVLNNRPFGTDNGGNAGERVVEGIFAAGKPNTGAGSFAYSTGDPRLVLLRWPIGEPDPDVAIGSWLADVTYEMTPANEASRATAISPIVQSYPMQRCHWYQVGRRSVGGPDPQAPTTHRSMTVTLSSPVHAKTLLSNDGTGNPAFTNAALLCPAVVNVFPRTFYNRK